MKGFTIETFEGLWRFEAGANDVRADEGGIEEDGEDKPFYDHRHNDDDDQFHVYDDDHTFLWSSS